MNYPLLLQTLAGTDFASLDDAGALAKLNAQSIVVWQELPKAEVENYMRNQMLSMKLSGFITRMDALSAAGQINLAAPEHANEFQLYIGAREVKNVFSGSIPFINGQNPLIAQVVAGFVAAGIFTQAESDAFFAQFKTHTSLSQQSFGSDVTASDIARARLQPKIDEVLALHARVASNTNTVTGTLSALVFTLESGTDAPVPTWDAVAASWGQG